MAFKLYYNYKLELLAEQFAEVVYIKKTPDDSAAALLRSDTVVVQTRGMAEFLRQYLAERCTIAANINMPFINSFVNGILTDLYGSGFKEAAFRSDPENMRYLIMKILSDEKAIKEDLSRLYDYIAGVNCELKRWQLAGAIAGVFDQYQLYRSSSDIQKMFQSADRSNSWQKVLYEKIFNDAAPGRNDFFEKFSTEPLNSRQIQSLPERIAIFGISSMPPGYLDFFLKLASYTQVDCFYLTPCMEYWENQRSRREIKKPEPWEVAEAGNPILQNLGRQGRSFFSCIMNRDIIANQLEPESEKSPQDYPPGSTMLDIMQYDVRYLFDRRKSCSSQGNDLFTGQARPDLKNDRSIAVHNCHCLRRELEVLHDELLKLIQQGTDPGSIIVMTPDIATAAPVINAVFGNGELANVYSIADMPQNNSANAWGTFKSILNTAGSRFEYTNVLALLDMPMINSVLKFSSREFIKISDLLYQAGARWGFDEEMRKKFCGNAFKEFSWQQAIDRLLAGFANRTASGNESSITGGCKVMDALEDPDIEAFARMVKLLQKLKELSDTINDKKDIPAWCTLFEGIMDNFFASDNSDRTALAPLRSAVRKLQSVAAKDFFPGTYPLSAALQMLEDHISNSAECGRFLRGKITFCRMMPMRSIPMDTVAILELNEGNFPRNKPDLGFDLIPLLPQPGDRSQTAQDRYLLLEAVMAARKNLLFFYQGQDSRNGEEVPPCAPLSEIMAYLASAFELKEYKHKISGISEVYFTADAEFPSLNRSNYKALEHFQKFLEQAQQTTISKPSLGDFYTGWQIEGDISITELVNFFANPCKWFLKNQFNLSYNNNHDQSDNDELWNLNPLYRYSLNKLFIDMRINNSADEDIYTHAVKSNYLSPLRVGRRQFEKSSSTLAKLPEFWQNTLKTMQYLPAVWRPADKNYSISGMVHTTADQKYVLEFNWSKYKSKHALNALFGALTLAAGAGNENRSAEVGAKLINFSNNGFELRKIDPIETADAIKLLDDLVALAGEKYPAPLPLFETSSVYYQEPSTAKSKFMVGEHCDTNAKEVNKFYTADMWDNEDFLSEFNKYAGKLYSLIKKETDD